MDISAIIALAMGGGLVALALVILVARHGQGQNRAEGENSRKGKTLCGGCRRAMRPDWTKCLFCGWQPGPPVPRLEFLCGPLSGQTFPLHEEVTTLGSVQGNSIVLSDPAVSRKHAGIRRVGNQFEFADLGSTNGVYVNGHRLPKKLLAPGDIVRVGNTEIAFRLE